MRQIRNFVDSKVLLIQFFPVAFGHIFAGVCEVQLHLCRKLSIIYVERKDPYSDVICSMKPRSKNQAVFGVFQFMKSR